MNTRRYLSLFCLIIAGYSVVIKALNQPQCINKGSKPFVQQRFSATVGPLFNFARYKFNNNNVECCNGLTTNCCEFPRAQGYLAGLHVDFTHSRPSHWYANVQFDGEWNAGYVNNTANTFLQVKDYRPEFDFGYNFFIQKNHYFITPFIGLGFYYLSTEFKHQMMSNKYNNLYIPIGFNATWNVHPECYENVVECFTIGITATYRIDAWTRVSVDNCPNVYCNNPCNASCVIPAYNLCANHLKPNSRTQGVHIEMPCTWFPTYNNDAINFIAVGAPFFDWNHFGSACATSCETDAGIPIPRLNRWYLGVHAQLGIRF